MSTESYFNHPTFGMLFRICDLEEDQELYTTLYAQRLFFLVKHQSSGLNFDSISRSEARLIVENRLRHLRRLGNSEKIQPLQLLYKQTFQ
jgi:PII interaction protein X